MSKIKEIHFFYDYEGTLLNDVHLLELQFVTETCKKLSNCVDICDEDFSFETIEEYWEIVSSLSESCDCTLIGEINLQSKPYDSDDLKFYQDEIEKYNRKYNTDFKLVYNEKMCKDNLEDD